MPSVHALSALATTTYHRRFSSVAPKSPRQVTNHRSLTIKSSIGNKPKPTSTAKNGSWVSPDWLTALTRSLSTTQSDDSNIPIANAKLEDVSDLLGGALFLPLFKWMNEYGPIYRLAAGPRNFVIVSDPEIAKHVLRNYGTKYAKGLVAEVSEFLFGSGFAIAEGSLWTARRRAVVPSLHKKYLSVIVDRVFCKCSERFVDKLKSYALNDTAVNMEEQFSQLTLDVIGLAVFNYNFDSLTTDSPVIESVYTALKEAEARSTDLLPYWKIKALCKIIPRQIKAEQAVTVIRETVEELIMKCKDIVEKEGEKINEEDYVNDADPSILRFLLASREEVSSEQLRDDLLSMLVAGHETTGSVLTWTTYLLSKDPSSLMKAQEEVDRVLQGCRPTYEDIKNLKFLTRCINESMRLYPHPPVLIRRAQVTDELPGNYKVNPGQDIMISVYNIHHSSKVWERAEEFIPERFGLDGPVPNETNTDYNQISGLTRRSHHHHHRRRKVTCDVNKWKSPLISKYNVLLVLTVDQKRCGNFSSLQKAVNAVPDSGLRATLIILDSGTYREKVSVNKNKTNLIIQGQGYLKTEITWNDTANSTGGTVYSSTVSIFAPKFIAYNISFKNTAPPPKTGMVGAQAVAGTENRR